MDDDIFFLSSEKINIDFFFLFLTLSLFPCEQLFFIFYFFFLFSFFFFLFFSKDSTIKTMNQYGEQATLNNQPELAKLIQQKVLQMNATVHGVEVSVLCSFFYIYFVAVDFLILCSDFF